MRNTFARALAARGVPVLPVVLVLASGCIDEARCDAALEGVARAQREAAHRDQQIAWLGWRQAELSRVVGGAARADADPEREAMQQRIMSLQAENASLIVRLGRAEREIAAPRTPESKRRLDEVTPYDRKLFSAPRERDEDELFVHRDAPRTARALDEAVPYEAPSVSSGAQRARRDAHRSAIAPLKRTLDEAVPY